MAITKAKTAGHQLNNHCMALPATGISHGLTPSGRGLFDFGKKEGKLERPHCSPQPQTGNHG
jgi:hypothetical protein